MAFKEVATLDADITIALGGRNKATKKDNPKQVEGYYLGSRQVKSPKSKNGLAYIHFLQTPKGNIGVWGKTDLDRKLTSVTPGTMTRITQSGMQSTPNGDMYKFKVELDETNTIEVDLIAASSGSDESDSNNDNANYDDGGSTEEESNSPEEAALMEAELEARNAAAEARRSRTQALFKNRKAN